MALGGVATGNMKAKDAAIVPGSIRNKGFIPREEDWGVCVKVHGLCFGSGLRMMCGSNA